MPKTKLPTDEEIERTWQPYVVALGEVAHSWNALQESLAQLFSTIIGADRMGLAIWYSSNDDRTQRRMLRAVIDYLPDDYWPQFPAAKGDILWLLDEADKVANKRNDAIHAPCAIAPDESGFKIISAYFWGNPRARNLMNKDILKEFRWYELSANTLNTYVRDITTSLDWHEPRAWPDKPVMPTLGQRSIRRGSRRSKETKPPRNQRASSQE